mmetsp:Transcript_16607/g.14501  ORF Transcript_16607/g.14501 Transcript_16607/m.14501 type:complete len:271 (-) Transcript_16607:29-841(-)
MVSIIIGIFQQRGDVFEEAFLALSAIANKIPEALDQKIEELGPFLVHGLKSDNAAIIRNVCGLISDLCTVVSSPGIIRGFQEYMPILLDHLKNPDSDASAQIIIISLIGDTFLLTKDKFTPFFEESLNLLEGAAKMAAVLPEDLSKKNEELFNLSQFQSSLVEAYTCFVQNIRESSEQLYQSLGCHISNIFKFCMEILDSEFQPSESIMREIAGLVGDIASQYGSTIHADCSNNQRLNKLVQNLQESPEEEDRSLANFVVEEVNRVLKSN